MDLAQNSKLIEDGLINGPNFGGGSFLTQLNLEGLV